MEPSCINYKDTGYFSQTVIDYLDDKPELRPFYGNRPDMKGFKAILQNRKVIGNRELLAKVLTRQYEAISQLTINQPSIVQDNINLLKSKETYTVTTGH